MGKPIFSVIIPTYNRVLLLKNNLTSLTRQTFMDFEVLVCDDGSTDNTEKMVKQFSHQLNLKYFYCENFGGPAKPRNIGVHNAQSENLCFLDADDLWHDTKLEVVAKYVDEFDFIYHGFEIADRQGQIVRRHKNRILRKPYFENLMLYDNPIVNSSVCVKKDLVLSVGGIEEKKELIAVEDFDLWLRLTLRHKDMKIKCIKKYLGVSGMDTEATNISTRGQFMLNKQVEIFSIYIDKLKPKLKPKSRATFQYKFGRNFQDIGKYTNAIQSFCAGLRSPRWDYKLKSFVLIFQCFFKNIIRSKNI